MVCGPGQQTMKMRDAKPLISGGRNLNKTGKIDGVKYFTLWARYVFLNQTRGEDSSVRLAANSS